MAAAPVLGIEIRLQSIRSPPTERLTRRAGRGAGWQRAALGRMCGAVARAWPSPRRHFDTSLNIHSRSPVQPELPLVSGAASVVDLTSTLVQVPCREVRYQGLGDTSRKLGKLILKS